MASIVAASSLIKARLQSRPPLKLGTALDGRMCCLNVEQQSEGCVKYASCGQVGKTPEYCRTHKTPGMVNLISRRCSVEGCEVRDVRVRSSQIPSAFKWRENPHIDKPWAVRSVDVS